MTPDYGEIPPPVMTPHQRILLAKQLLDKLESVGIADAAASARTPADVTNTILLALAHAHVALAEAIGRLPAPRR